MTRPHLYSRVLKTKTSYFTQIDGQYVPLGSDKVKAERKLDELLGLNEQDSIEAMCRSYIKDQRRMLAEGDKNALAPVTIDDYETSLEKNVIPVFGKMRPSDFRPAHAAQFLYRARNEIPATVEGEKPKKPRPVRANRDMAALGSAFNHGMVLGLVESNPCRGVKRNKERPRTREVRIAEFNAFLAHAKAKGGSAYLVALIGSLTAISGRRRAEILSLPLSAATDSGIRCVAAKKKAGDPVREYLIEWSPLIRQLFTEIQTVKRRVSSLFLFPNHDGQPYTDSGFKCLWNRLMHSYAPDGPTSPKWFRAHDFRALYVSNMLGKGLNPNTHQNEETMKRVYDRRGEIKITPLG